VGLSPDPDKRDRQLANLRRAPAPPSGNRRALRHGGYAQVARERLEAKTLEVYDAIAADAPLRDTDGGLPAADAAMVRLLAEALCRLDDVAANVRDYGLLDQETGAVRPVVELERRLRQEAADHLDALGMTARSRSRLGLELTRTFDLAQAMAEDAELERRERELEERADG
jgi:hypothetical protein